MEFIEYHYVYYSYEEYGKGYIGSRTCKCFPTEDVNYFGSFKDKSFKPTQKIILKDDYSTREEAYIDEIILQEYYRVVENLHFANRAYQTSTKFFYVPTKNSSKKRKPMSEEQKIKLSNIAKGKKISEKQRQIISQTHKNKKVSEETRKKMSESAKKRIYKNREEWIEKIKKGRKGQSSWNRGIPWGEEIKQKISNTLKLKNKV
jgi:hypothetical protein